MSDRIDKKNNIMLNDINDISKHKTGRELYVNKEGFLFYLLNKIAELQCEIEDLKSSKINKSHPCRDYNATSKEII